MKLLGPAMLAMALGACTPTTVDISQHCGTNPTKACAHRVLAGERNELGWPSPLGVGGYLIERGTGSRFQPDDPREAPIFENGR